VKYEYKVQPVSLGDEDPQHLQQDEGVLNQLGREEWELVAVVPSPQSYLALGKSLLYVLKRPIQ